MLMLQALHYRYCILLYCNINKNFQPIYSEALYYTATADNACVCV